jgi:hypothetical protein
VLPPTIRSQACCRQGTLKCPDGTNQFGKNGEGLMARSAKSAPYPDAFVLVVMSLAEPSPVADDGVVTTKRAQPR